MVERMIGAALLNPAAYEEVEADKDATSQALLVVVLAAIANGIGTLLTIRDVSAFIVGIILGIVGWVVYAAAAYLVGTTILRGPETQATLGQVLRTLGFANTPRLLLILSFIPILGVLIGIVVFIWTLLTTVIAVRQALDVSTGRAIAVAIVAVLLLLVVSFVLGLLFAPVLA